MLAAPKVNASSKVDVRLALYLVEPSVVVSEALATLFDDRVRTFKRFPSAESLLRERSNLAPRRFLVTELHLPGMNGIELMLALKHHHLTTPTMITAIEADVHTAVHAMRRGAVNFVEKPFIADELLDGLCKIESGLG